jgi:tight adherence protein C
MTVLLLSALALSIGFGIIAAVQLLPGRERAVRARLSEIEQIGTDPHSPVEQRRRYLQAERVLEILEFLGQRLQGGAEGAANVREMLAHAGYRSTGAPAIYWALRLAVGLGLFTLFFISIPIMGLTTGIGLFVAIYFGLIGYVVPLLYVRSRVRGRKKDLQHALADTLDLLVVCVEAGLGLNQALMRVAEEIRHVSMLMSAELLYTNAEIRAGTPRDAALRNLADRTGVEDLSSLVAMLIQTDRFGTSVARSLRVHSDVLRQKRRQRAEEAAAKTAIKMIFPLVFCIFPAMFVVILGPAAIRIVRALSGLG